MRSAISWRTFAPPHSSSLRQLEKGVDSRSCSTIDNWTSCPAGRVGSHMDPHVVVVVDLRVESHMKFRAHDLRFRLLSWGCRILPTRVHKSYEAQTGWGVGPQQPAMAPVDARLEWLKHRSCQLLDVQPTLFDPLLQDPAGAALLKDFVNGGELVGTIQAARKPASLTASLKGGLLPCAGKAFSGAASALLVYSYPPPLDVAE